MSTTIRQEINILDAPLSAAGGAAATSSAIVQLDTSQYVNPTYYFEVVADSTISISFNVTLRRKGTSTDDVTVNVPLLTTAFTRKRSASFTPPAGATEYVVQIDNTAGATKNVNAARIIIIDNPTTLTSTETQIEIGDQETGLVSLTAAPLNTPKYWLYTAANWDGTKTFYAEVTYLMAASKNGGTFTLQEDNGSFASWADKVTIVSAGVATAATRVRSASFVPTDGRHYRIAYLVSGTKTAASIFNAKIIVDQQRVPDSYSPGNINQLSQFYSGAFGKGQSFTGDGNVLKDVICYFSKTGSPTGNVVAKIYAHSGTYGTSSIPTGAALATSDNIDVTTFPTGTAVSSLLPFQFNFSGANQITLTNATNYFLSIEYSNGGALNTTVIWIGYDSTSPTASGNYATSANFSSWTADSTIDLAFIIHTDVYTLLEPQYLLLNTADSGTGRMHMDTLYDANEWVGVTNVYTHEHNATNAADSSKLYDITAAADVTSSTITGTNSQESAALTFTDDHEIDVNVVTSTGVVGSSRIIAAVTVNSAVSASIAQLAASVTATGGTQAISAIIIASAAIAQLAASVTGSGGTQVATTNATVAQVAANVIASGGTQTIATVNNVSIAQLAGAATASGGTQALATSNLVAISQVAASVTATGGTQAVATVNNVSVAQAAGAVTGAGGTQDIAAASSTAVSQSGATVTASGGTQLAQTNSSNSQVAANVTAAGGTQAIASIENASVAQSAGSTTTSGGTQALATVNIVAISQIAGTVTAAGGTQLAQSNSSNIQAAAAVTATGGTQSVKTNASIAQLAATVTASGGTQVIATANIVSLAQLAGSITASGGTQVVASVENVAISQLAGAVTATGGTQTVSTGSIVSASVTQVAGAVTASGGTQAVDTVNIVALSQSAATVTASGGAQVVATVNDTVITQLAANVAASGGVQAIATTRNVALDQVAANVTAMGSAQSISSGSGATSASIGQIGVSVVATGGVQTLAIANSVSVIQISENIVAGGGTQTIATINSVNLVQLAGVVVVSGGRQRIRINGHTRWYVKVDADFNISDEHDWYELDPADFAAPNTVNWYNKNS